MEPLIELPREYWPKLCNLYRCLGRDGAEACCLLDIQIAHPALAEEFDIHIYCPEGILTNGMVATSLMNDYYQVMIQPIGKNITKIEEALLTTKIIDWNRDVMVPFANLTAIECLERMKVQLGLNVFYNVKTKAYTHFLDKRSKMFEDLVIPPNTYIRTLRSEHIGIVDKTWTYSSEHSYKTFEILMKNNLSYVLYSKGKAKAEERSKETKDGEKADLCENPTLEECGKIHVGNKVTEAIESVSKVGLETTVKDVEGDTKATKQLQQNSDEPLAWLSVNEHGALSHLFCSEQHRKKGYAEIITKYVVNELLSKNLNVIAYTTEYNVNPKNLFRKLGFEELLPDYWVIVNKVA